MSLPTQTEYVSSITSYYRNNDIVQGDPHYGEWEVAHFPLPKDLGNETVLLLHEHHQIQGLLQSKELDKMCFFPGHAKAYLDRNFGCEHWFELYEVYEQTTRKHGRNKIQECHKTQHAVKDDRGRSKHAVTAGTKGNESKHSILNDKGQSVSAVEMSKEAIKKTSKAIQVTSKFGDVYLHSSLQEAARSLDLSPQHLSSVALGKRPHHKGYTAEYLEFNPFYV